MKELISIVAPYVTSIVTPILTVILGFIKQRDDKSTKELSRYIGIRKALCDSGYQSNRDAISNIDYIIESETHCLKEKYEQQMNTKFNIGGLIAVLLIGALETLTTFFLIQLALLIPDILILRIIVWSVIAIAILFMILFIAIGAKTVVYQKIESSKEGK
ncbi:hypothetical protein [Bifidobacterium vespertilionis]|uniref:hypothetical protein n=1 Tax=Bifidobacterium vespertilionis TaxID=2562524 RepID=UPI001BDD05B5|nr:hypothetical protein [Bifidobacterium vespertilionis]MBT1180091.1 hypothetical protein [Bifidobacterium vespertilionis]